MDFALAPENGLPRLWRYVDAGPEADAMTKARIVSTWHPKQNLLIINRSLFDQLAEMNRHIVLHTHRQHEYV